VEQVVSPSAFHVSRAFHFLLLRLIRHLRSAPDERNPVIAEIQCLPRPSGTDDDPYAHVHAAIEQIESSGLTYEVSALGTTVEGEPSQVWPLLQTVHEACITAGADSVITVIKVSQSAATSGGATMAGLVSRYRD
jgi:uncharacterized protein YqgV (UPF0045/DUF77 family)